MSSAHRSVPEGYTRIAGQGGNESGPGVHAVAVESLAAPLAIALKEGSFYAYAAHHPAARRFSGRGIAYAVPLPDPSVQAVVRRSRHGGLLAPVTGELFLGDGRAPHELDVSLRLTKLGVPTPEVLAYATYPAGSFMRRADVVTREIPKSVDLAGALAELTPADEKRPLLAAVAKLLAALTVAGARHPDLNLKNVLLTRDANGEPEAWLLDVDRVWFDTPGSARVTDRNLGRLARSARKWRLRRGLAIQEADILWIAATTEELTSSLPR